MIKFPVPKVPKQQRYGATRSKVGRAVADARRRDFLAGAARGNLSAVTAAMSAPIEAKLGIEQPDGTVVEIDGAAARTRE